MNQSQVLVLSSQQACVNDLQDQQTAAFGYLDFYRKPCAVCQPDILHHAECVSDSEALCTN